MGKMCIRCFFSILKLRRFIQYKRRGRHLAFICSLMFLFLAVYLLYDITITSTYQPRHLNHNVTARDTFKRLTEKDHKLSRLSTGSNIYGNGSHVILQECIHPKLELWNSDVNEYLYKTKSIVCQNESEWVYTKDGNFYISSDAVNKHGYIVCAYVPLVNNADTLSVLKTIQPMLNGSKLISDAFKVVCKAADGQTYANIHACIATENQTTTTRDRSQKDKKSFRWNVLMFGFDSLSRHMFQRILPASHKYFTQVLGGKILEGYNIVGDGTPQALMPILTGRSETEIPEVRRGMKNAKHLDEVLTFIWKRYQDEGYITQWGEDMANIGTFNLRMLGFKTQPVDHYMRPFYLATIPFYNRFLPNCIGSRPRHKLFIDWIKEGLQTNREYDLFTFGFFSEFSHHDNNLLAQADGDVMSFLKFLNNEGYLENTVLILMSDHGVRFGRFRNTEQGKLEERMPYFGFRFPDGLRLKYPKHIQNFEGNTKRLVTPFDIHETLLDILNMPQSSASSGNVSSRGISLFKKIPQERSCAHASIEPHWCACLQWKEIPLHDHNVQMAVKSVINLVNSLTYPYKQLCNKLKLDKLVRAISYRTNENVLKFKHSTDYDGRIPDLSDKLQPKAILYQVTFQTTPGLGLFEATVSRDLMTETFTANENEISRLNMYGSAADCIVKKAPKLRPYCLCYNQNVTKPNTYSKQDI